MAGTGAAHFVAPKAFEPISRRPFPDDTRRWVLRNGATEVAIGLAIAGPRTRALGIAALACYATWLATRFAAR
ncbi:hypothetical protein [Actinokineospora sp. UTMC 2448]|uniref:hypothetical protein n=1 Tax=Actinokineospora sp. UTMC 2448 TaxID=2268449 RepID=UPI0021646670|nr:hypothetical protein [Actinokineospora sp. UTMC 2448]